jgi:hypothetical protein
VRTESPESSGLSAMRGGECGPLISAVCPTLTMFLPPIFLPPARLTGGSEQADSKSQSRTNKHANGKGEPGVQITLARLRYTINCSTSRLSLGWELSLSRPAL